MAVFNDLLLGIRRSLPGLRLDAVLRRSDQFLPRISWEILHVLVEVLGGPEAEDELHSSGMPPVEIVGLGEVRVSTQPDALEARPHAEAIALSNVAAACS
ncbi:MAG: hypothetical protein ACKOHG_10780 [Planctomycetia bacterium]